jgi:hypothetical protein
VSIISSIHFVCTPTFYITSQERAFEAFSAVPVPYKKVRGGGGAEENYEDLSEVQSDIFESLEVLVEIRLFPAN